MAIAVPVLMAAAGATASTIAITTIAFSVTGISAKINKAAEGVFGKDLVAIGNLFGAAYGAFTGGFGAMSGGSDGLNAVNGLDAASDAFAASGAANAGGVTFAETAGLAGGNMGSLANMAGDAVNGSDLMSDTFVSNGGAGGFGVDVIEGAAPVADVAEVQPVADSPDNAIERANSQSQTTSLIPGTGATSQQAAAQQGMPTQAAAPQAAAPQPGPARVTATGGAAPRSFFDRLVFDEKGNVSAAAMRAGGQVLSGVGQGYSAGQAARQKQQQFDATMAEERRRRSQGTGLRLTR